MEAIQQHRAVEWFPYGTQTPSQTPIKMNVEQSNRLMAKCLEIYQRKKCLLPVHQFLERLESRDGFEVNLSTAFWEESLIPEIKKRYFADVTIDSLLENSIALYRSYSDRALALELVWKAIEWKYPFDQETYTEFVDRLDELLEKESNPPTESDWDNLEESIMK